MNEKQKVFLVFPTMSDLWSFTKSARINPAEIVTAESMLICECSGVEIELAQEKYNAMVKRGNQVPALHPTADQQ